MNVSPILALAGLITIALLVPRLTSLRWPRVPSLDLFVLTGGALVALGLVLGPGIDFLDRATIIALAPATALAIGWVGARFGSHFEWRLLRRIPRGAWLLAALSSAAAMIAVALAAWLATRLVPALATAWTPRLPALLTLGALAAAAGPGVVALVLRTAKVPKRVGRPIVLAAMLETACAVVAVSVPLALHRRGSAVIAWLAWVGAAGLSGALVASLFLWLTQARTELDRAQLDLVVLATVLLGAGIGSATGITPFVICFLASGLIVNLSPRRRAFHGALAGAERPLYAALFVLAGALLTLPTAWILLVVPFLGGVCAAAKWAAVRFGRAPLGSPEAPRDVGLATIAQGGVVVALGLSAGLLYGGALLATIVLLVAASVVSARPLAVFALRAQSASPPLTRSTASAELSATMPVESPR